MNKKHLAVILILLVASLLRLWGLNRGDTMNDEVFYAFRAIGPMDFDHAELQTTPLEWLDPRQNFAPQNLGGQAHPNFLEKNLGGQADIPSWTKLSFHDHPPLVFWVQHFFIKIFGENNFAFRLPSALLGVASVLLIYLIGRLLYWRQVGLLAAAIFAATLNNVYISRTGLQEAYVIFFILLASLLFLKALERDTNFLWLGAILGLAFLTKYTTFILLPIFLVYILWFRRGLLFNKKLWIGAALAFLIFSPVVIYNIQLYRAVGHFDFQFSYIFGQNPEVWQAAPGKEIGTLQDRFEEFIPRLIATHSWALLLLFGVSVVFFLWGALREPHEIFSTHKFLLTASIFIGFWIVFFIGSSFRFLTILTPFLVFPVALLLDTLYYYKFAASGLVIRKEIKLPAKSFFFVGLILFFSFEVAYSYNSQISYYPTGSTPWFSSKIRYENYNWGYNDLDKYLKKELVGKLPAYVFDMQYKFLEKVRDTNLLKARKEGLEFYPALIAYYGNFDDGAKLWVLERLMTYHGWPVITLEDYFDMLKKNGPDYFDKTGFKQYYFIVMTNIEPTPQVREFIKNISHQSIFNKRGDEIFRIYRVSRT